ncbi:MAG TPA: bacteriophage N4 adsorption protein A [Noviherbaspirillum sp.]|nr:bacteriophage N4 adsorption protein A [Noviherbaspirillum sp.]
MRIHTHSLLALAAVLVLAPAHAEQELLLSGPAYTLAQDAYQAYEHGNYDTAIVKVREAIRLRPDVARLRGLLNQALAAKRGHIPAARQESGMDAGYRDAATAYRRYDRQDYAAAVAFAQRAVAAATANRAYRLLLVNALLAAGRDREASRAIDDALERFPNDAELLLKRTELQRTVALREQDRMYQALEGGDHATAIEAARAAIALTPDARPVRLLLIQSLLTEKRTAEAQHAAEEALRTLGPSSALLALRGYARQLGGNAEAQEDFERALSLAPPDGEDSHELALIAVDAALASHQPEVARARLAAAGSDKRVAERAKAIVRAARTPADAQPPFGVPEVRCTQNNCVLVAGSAARDPGFDAASAAYAALATQDYATAAAKAGEAVAASPTNDDYRRLLFDALAAQKDDAAAERAASELLTLRGDDADMLVQRGYLRLKLQKTLEAKQDFNAALAAGGLDRGQQVRVLTDLERGAEARAALRAGLVNGDFARTSDVDLAYLATHAGDDETALQAFERADTAGKLPDRTLQDAAFAAMRAQRDAQAVGYLKRSINAVDGMRLRMEPELLYSTKRAVTELSREGGVLASVRYGSGAPVAGGPLAPTNTANDTAQLGVEAWWRPFGFRNGRPIEVYARAFATLYSKGGDPTGARSMQGMVGARWKPWSGQNFVFSFNRLVPLGSTAREDWLAQAAYSAGVGTDLAPVASNWFTAQGYAEVGHYFRSGENYVTASGQIGRSYRMDGVDPQIVLFPHLSLAADYNSTFATTSAFGLGPGITFRHWFRGDMYAAPRSYVDVTLQRRVPVGGDGRDGGWFFVTTLSY